MPNDIVQSTIESRIITIRNQQVMLDRDLAELYGVETRRLNEQVKRNIERFPDEFMFQLNEDEFQNWMSHFATSNSEKIGLRKKPYAFTEHGVTMLASVLKSTTAVKASIQIVKAFVSMRHFLQSNAEIFGELKSIRRHQLETDIHQKETDKKVSELFTLIDKYNVQNIQGIFFQGQIFDAYAKFESFIAQAQREIILIDNYVDISILERFSKKAVGVNVVIYTSAKSKLTVQDIQKFNAQYPMLTVNTTSKMHDRFLIIDQKILYHIGASLKDLGKKCFGFEVLDNSFIPLILNNL